MNASNVITHLEGEELRIALSQAAALAVKQVRANQYNSAFAIADAILKQTPEVIEHRNSILGIVNNTPFEWLETLDNENLK
jgi:hypothetical protein